MNLSEVTHFHFIGIGGIGMSGLAEILLHRGAQVSGSDLKDSPLLERLRGLGARVFMGHDTAQVQGAEAVIFSSAVHDDNPELAGARSLGLPVLHRGELLAELMRPKKGITISGTHGKTTTTSMIGLMLVHAGLDPTIVVGARLDAIQSNVRVGVGEWFAAEADESDRSFLLLSPFCAVTTNIDLDHMDEYRDLGDLQEAFFAYMGKVPEDGLVVACGDDSNLAPVLKKLHRRMVTYGLRPGVDICAQNPDLAWRRSNYQCYAGGQRLGEVELKVPGQHNVLNSLAAVAVGLRLLQLPFDVIAQSLATFRGAERRLQWKGEKRGVWVIDDYAHHPAEIRATLQACRTSGRRIVAVFQPHRYSRTQTLMQELAGCFEDADVLYLMDIYAAGEKPIAGVTSERLARELAGRREVNFVRDRKDLLARLANEAKDGDLVVTLGAGDVWQMGEKFLETDE